MEDLKRRSWIGKDALESRGLKVNIGKQGVASWDFKKFNKKSKASIVVSNSTILTGHFCFLHQNSSITQMFSKLREIIYFYTLNDIIDNSLS